MSRVDLGAMDKLQQFARIGPAERELIAMATAELRAARELLACATEFEISERVTVAQRKGIDAVRWAVYRDRSFCLAKDGEWEYEPLPSSRDDAFIERCRFGTLAEAIAAMRAAVEKARKAC